MKKKLIAVLILAGFIFGCSAPHMKVDSDLQKNAGRYEVKGRNGWLVNQKLSFGEYHSSKVNRSWTKGYDFPFIIRFSGAKEKLHFSMQDSHGNTAEIFCLGKLREQDLLLFHKYFDINIKAKDAFTGSVALSQSNSYDFYVANLNQNNWFKEAKGHVFGNNLNIEIRPVKHLNNDKKMLDMHVPGFEFFQDGKIVGAVETLNKGEVWLANYLTKEERLVLAGVASALLLRSELAEHNYHLM